MKNQSFQKQTILEKRKNKPLGQWQTALDSCCHILHLGSGRSIAKERACELRDLRSKLHDIP